MQVEPFSSGCQPPNGQGVSSRLCMHDAAEIEADAAHVCILTRMLAGMVLGRGVLTLCVYVCLCMKGSWVDG